MVSRCSCRGLIYAAICGIASLAVGAGHRDRLLGQRREDAIDEIDGVLARPGSGPFEHSGSAGRGELGGPAVVDAQVQHDGSCQDLTDENPLERRVDPWRQFLSAPGTGRQPFASQVLAGTTWQPQSRATASDSAPIVLG